MWWTGVAGLMINWPAQFQTFHQPANISPSLRTSSWHEKLGLLPQASLEDGCPEEDSKDERCDCDNLQSGCEDWHFALQSVGGICAPEVEMVRV